MHKINSRGLAQRAYLRLKFDKEIKIFQMR